MAQEHQMVPGQSQEPQQHPARSCAEREDCKPIPKCLLFPLNPGYHSLIYQQRLA